MQSSLAQEWADYLPHWPCVNPGNLHPLTCTSKPESQVPLGPHGAVDGGRAAILESTRGIPADGSVSTKPIDHNTATGDGAGFHHMHRLDLLMCLYKRVFEVGPKTGATCPIEVHMGKRLAALRQDPSSATTTFTDGSTAAGDVVVGADGINSKTL